MADIASAEKKLRQAEFFLGCLEGASKEVACGGSTGNPERLEFLLSACLTAAQSVYTVLEETGGRKFQQIRQNDGSSRLKKLKRLRGEDVHRGKTDAKPLQKYIKDDHLRGGFPYQHSFIRNATLYGLDQPIVMENPDGEKVSGPSLRGAVGLYVKRDGKNVEATTACREFIEQLRSLLDTTKAAF